MLLYKAACVAFRLYLIGNPNHNRTHNIEAPFLLFKLQECITLDSVTHLESFRKQIPPE